MATSSEISVGLAHELVITATKAGWEPKDYATLAHSEERAREVLAYLRGLSEIKSIQHLIDCDVDPFLPNKSWNVEEHQKGGVFTWDSTKVSLFFSKSQKNGKQISGIELRSILESRSVLNANVLDYLLKNPHLIPEDWKGGNYVFFWGTVYRNSRGLLVRHLYWRDRAWHWGYVWVDNCFDSFSPAAMLES